MASGLNIYVDKEIGMRSPFILLTFSFTTITKSAAAGDCHVCIDDLYIELQEVNM